MELRRVLLRTFDHACAAVTDIVIGPYRRAAVTGPRANQVRE